MTRYTALLALALALGSCSTYQPVAPWAQTARTSSASAGAFYRGRMVEHITYLYPRSSPLPPVSSSAVLTEHVLTHESKSKNGQVIYQVDAGEDESGRFTTGDWALHERYEQDAKTGRIHETGFGISNASGDSAEYTYAGLGPVAESIPLARGSWTNTNAGSLAAMYSDGESIAASYNPDGSYDSQESFKIDGTDTVRVLAHQSADGSADVESVSPLVGDSDQRYGFSTPSNLISLRYVSWPDGSSPSSGSHLVVAWLPWFSRPGYTEEDVDTGIASIPNECHVPKSLGVATAEDVRSTARFIDAASGTDERSIEDRYVNGIVICLSIHQELISYYDWSGTAGRSSFGGAPISIDDTSEILTLQSPYAGPPFAPYLQPISPTDIAVTSTIFSRRSIALRQMFGQPVIKEPTAKGGRQ